MTFIPPRASVKSISQIAFRLQHLVRQNRDTAALNFPVLAIARYLGIHRDTLYAAAGGEPVSRLVQMLLTRFLRRVDLGEIKAEKIGGRWKIVAVESPTPRLMLRVDLGLGAAGPRLSAESHQPTPTMPSFSKLLLGR